MSLALVCVPQGALGQRIDDKFTEFAMGIGGGARFSSGIDEAVEAEFVLSLSMFNIDGGAYRSYGVELWYGGNDAIEMLSIMPRVELGLRDASFGGRSGGQATVTVPYLALMAGYGSGTVWEDRYIEIYGSIEAVEIDVTGVPLYGAVGLRRIGILNVNLEAVGGLFLVTSQEAERPEAEAPTVIPSIGLHLSVGTDTFSYIWN
jgi:hypothetical protein